MSEHNQPEQREVRSKRQGRLWRALWWAPFAAALGVWIVVQGIRGEIRPGLRAQGEPTVESNIFGAMLGVLFLTVTVWAVIKELRTTEREE